MSKIIKLAVGTLAFVMFSQANAALVNYIITGDVLVGMESTYNDYSLFGGDTVIATGFFDDAVLVTGTGTVDVSYLSGNSMSIFAGALTLYPSHDLDWMSFLTFENYQLVDFDYYAHAGVNGAPSGFRSALLAFDDLGGLSGQWQSTVDFTPVPVPAAAWLFVSGILGLLGLFRRRHP